MAVVALVASFAAAQAEGVSEVIPAEPGSPEFAVARRAAESLGLPAPSALSTADLDNDGFPEFLAFGEGGARILRLGATGWSEISGGGFAGLPGLGELAVTADRFNGMPVLAASGREFAWLDGVFRPLSEITPSALDLSAFTPACEKNESIAFLHEENGSPAAGIADFCGCVADQWRLRNAPQAVFDVYVRELDGIFREEDRDERAEFDTLIALTDEALFACKTQRGWTADLPYPYGQPMFDGKARAASAEGLVDACRAQDWVVANRKVATPGRALGFCGCVAGHLALNGMSGDGFDLVAALYSGDLSENEVAERDPSSIGASDEASEACIQSMPYR